MTGIDLYGTLQAQQTLEAELLLSASTGATDNYEQLKNRPSINGVVLSGDKLSENLYLASDEDLKTEATARENADNELLQKIENTALTAQAQGASFTLTDASNNCGLYSLYVEGESSQNGIPTPVAPIAIDSIGDSGSLDITTCGNQLANLPDVSPTTSGGITYSCNNGVVSFKGTATQIVSTMGVISHIMPKGIKGTFYISGSTANVTVYMQVKPANSSTNWYHNRSFTLDGTEQYARLYIQIEEGATVDDEIYPMLNKGTTALPFESFKGNTAIITSALPLCSVGDVKDEFIFNADGTAKVIKRTAIIDSYNGETIATEYISTSGELTTGATVVYPLVTPVEISLTADETATLLSLETFEGLTNVFSSDNAQMSVKYWRNQAVGSLLTSISRSTNSRLTALENAIIGG